MLLPWLVFPPRLVQMLVGVSLVALGCPLSALAQAGLPNSESAPFNQPSPQPPSPQGLQELPTPGPGQSGNSVDAPTNVVSLTLPQLLNLTIQGNRSLRNDTLERIIQRQQLNQAEQIFDPRFTPTLSVGVTQRLSSSGGFTVETDEGLTLIDDNTDFNQGAELFTELNTRQGTVLGLGLDPLDGEQPLQLTIRQPLLRGFGQAINEAPVEQARLAESRNQLTLRQSVISTLTTAIDQYTSLIEAQETVAIQVQALERRRRQLEILQALVTAGRRARSDLFDTERTVADAERDLIVAQNQLTQANTQLLNLVGTDRNLRFVASAETILELFAAAVAQVPDYDAEQLVQLAFQRRPDYQQAQLEQRNLELSQRLANDALRWRLDAEVDGNLGDFSQTNVGLVTSRTFDDPQLETQRVSSEIQLQQQANRLDQLREEIRNDVVSSLLEVQSNLARVEAAERSTQNAQQQLKALQEQFRRGGNNIDLFEIINQEEALVNAQNSELGARIAFLNSIATLEQTVGITVERWASQIDLTGVVEQIDPLPAGSAAP